MSKILKGFDASKWQGDIDWQKVKASGIDFVILRCGYTGYGKGKSQAIDKQFIKNYNGAKANGIPVGAYFFSRAVNEVEGVKEAKYVLALLQGKKFEYPIYIDVEDKYYQAQTDKHTLTKAVIAFCEILENAGYYVGIYASKSWFENNLDLNRLKAYDKWVAQWSDKCTLNDNFGMWQFTNKGELNGVNGRVDKDVAYKNYPSIMKKNGLNGFAKKANPFPEPKRAITRGHIGEDVKWVQWELVRLEYDIGKGINNEPKGIDGHCGPKTTQAIKDFQKYHKDQHGRQLKVDGYAGPLTRRVMLHA